jgi:hypothetical protein
MSALQDLLAMSLSPRMMHAASTSSSPALSQASQGVVNPPPNFADEPKKVNGSLDGWAQGVLAAAWEARYGAPAPPAAIQAIGAISRLESYYGWPKNEKWRGHHNWGAIQCRCYDKALDACIGGFRSKDKIKDDSGNWVPFAVCFEHRDTNEQGADRFLQILLDKRPGVAGVIDSGDAFAIAYEMRKTWYFVHTKNATDEQMRAEAKLYAKDIAYGAKRIAQNTGNDQLVFYKDPDGTDVPEDPNDPTYVQPQPASASSSSSGIGKWFVFGAIGVLGAFIVAPKIRR